MTKILSLCSGAAEDGRLPTPQSIRAELDHLKFRIAHLENLLLDDGR